MPRVDPGKVGSRATRRGIPERELEVVDCFMSKSEPIISFLEKVDYLLSVRLLFQPFDALKAQETRRLRKPA